MTRQWTTAVVLAAAILVSAGTAAAQKKTVPLTAANVATAEAAAVDASRGGKSPTNASSEFLQDQAKRAEAIRKKAEKQSGDRAFFENAEAVEKQRQANAAWVQAQRARAAGIANAAVEEAGALTGQGEQKGAKRPEYLVFVSQSMGATALKTAFEYGRGRTDVAFVFRGFLPGQSPMQFYAAMAKFQGKAVEEMMVVMLDPPAYSKFKIASVPAIVQINAKEDMVAKVTGLINPRWVADKVEDGRVGDLGTQGETYRIAELDLLEAMKAKANGLDLRKEMADAKNRFFRELGTIDLPYATKTRVRKIVPQLVVNDDVVDHTGRVRFRKGQKVSMQEHLKNAPVMVVFNSQDPYHVAFVKQVIARTPANKKVILMTTRIDREGGVPNYARQEFAIGRPVYLLMQDVRNTFGVENIPTVISANETEFVVVEVPLTQGVSGNGNARSKSP